MARQQSLMSFLKPLNKKQKEGIPVADLAATSDAGCSKLVERQSMTAEIHNRSNDIGTYIGKAVEDSTKILLLESPWTPSQNYNFPFSTRKVAGKEIKHYVSIKHLDAYKDWLVLSDFAKGLFCKYCALFTIRNEGGFRKNVLLRALVTEPLKNFKHLTGENGDLEAHSRHLYHKDAITSGKDFVRTYHNPNSEIRSLVDKNTKSLIKTNREILLPIVKTIILLGRQNIPLRGHRDDGPIRNGVVTKNEGNFRAMIRYRVDAGDKILENHLQSSSSRATYVSKTTQDKLIDCCRVEILNKILKKVYDSSFYSVIFDETPDLSGKAQVSFVLRYVDYLSDGPVIKEDFVTFIDAFGELSSCDQDIEDNERDTANEEISLTGVSIGQLVLKKMKEMKLKLENCVGIGTDGCAVMLAENGAVKEVQSEAINALMTPCFSHKLNNSISKSLKISLIEKTSSYIREVTRFFKSSRPKRNTVLAQFLGKKLVQLCETRWVERHDSVLQFISSLPEIVEALTRISMWKNKETAGKALVLIAALCSSEFVVGIFCLGDILSLTHPLSVILQKEAIDLAKASDVVSTLIATLLTRRQEADEYFDQLFNDAIQMANKLDIEIKKPRTCGRQKHRENYAIDDTKIFYRVSVYIPLLDNIIEDLKTRFSPAVMDVFKLTALLPENTLNLDSGQLKQISEDAIGRFGNLLEQKRDIQILRLKGELCHWQQKWRDQILSGIGELPRSAFETLQCCDSDIYPTIQKLLQIFCTLPVTNSSAERSFSSLRCIKTWLRTTMLENRLIGLALLHIHYDIVLNPEDVIERFSKMGNHRILL